MVSLNSQWCNFTLEIQMNHSLVHEKTTKVLGVIKIGIVFCYCSNSVNIKCSFSYELSQCITDSNMITMYFVFMGGGNIFIKFNLFSGECTILKLYSEVEKP